MFYPQTKKSLQINGGLQYAYTVYDRSIEGESHYLHWLCVIGQICGGGIGAAGLYPWTLGSQHEWSCAV